MTRRHGIICAVGCLAVLGVVAACIAACEYECYENPLCNGADVACPRCEGFLSLLKCDDVVSLDFNPGGLFIEACRVKAGTGKTCVDNQNVICRTLQDCGQVDYNMFEECILTGCVCTWPIPDWCKLCGKVGAPGNVPVMEKNCPAQ